jgi:hypothetical protein
MPGLSSESAFNLPCYSVFAAMHSDDLARYIEANGGLSKPWLLAQLRLAKLKERRSQMTPEAYVNELEDIHQDLMKLGEWWKGREREVFGDR